MDSATDRVGRHQTPPQGALRPARTLADDLAILDEHAENTLAALATHLELQAERGIKAWLLAPTIPTYEALMRGESVPADRLRSEHLHRYGWRA